MIVLLVNGVNVDLSGSEDIALDLALFSINDISSRKGSRSYSIPVPKTNNNRALFEAPDEINSLTNFPYRRFDARLLVDGVDQGIRFGTLESSNEFYNIRIYGDNADVFNSIKDLSLRDLDLSNYDHIWDFITVIGSRSATVGYIYPLIDWFSDSPNSHIDNAVRQISADFMLPCMFLKTVLNKIFIEQGFTLIDNTPDNEKILLATVTNTATRVLPSKYNATFRQTTDILLNDERFEIVLNNRLGPAFVVGQTITGITGGSIGSTGVIYNVVSGGAGTIFVRATNGTFAPPDQIDNGIGTTAEILSVTNVQANTEKFSKPNAIISYSGNWYSVPYLLSTLDFEDKFPIKINLSLNISNLNAQASTVNVFVKTGAMGQKGIAATLTVPAGSSTHNVSVADNQTLLDSFGVPVVFTLLNAPDNLLVSFQVKNGANVNILNSSTLQIDSQIQDELINGFNYGGRVQASTSLPDLEQAELFKSYLQMFALLPVTDYDNKTVTLLRFYDIITNLNNAVDWSDKVDLSEHPEITFVFEDYAQENTFKYIEEPGETKPTGTDGAINIDNNNLPATKDILTLPFAATNEVLRLYYLRLNQIGVFEDSEFKNEKKPRILYLDRKGPADIAPNSFVTYVDSLGANQDAYDVFPFTYFIQPGKSLNLGFLDNLLPTYYKALEDVLDKCKRVVLQVRLNATDISQLDFTRPVFIQYFNSYFYISKITGYKPDGKDSTEVELVKLF